MNPVERIIGKKIVKDSYGKNKKVLLLPNDDPNWIETDPLFQPKVIDDKGFPKDIKVPYLHPGGSVLEIYGRRKRK